LRPMRGLKRLRSAAVIATGHAFVQNLRRGFYELGLDYSPRLLLATAFTELAQALRSRSRARTQARPDLGNATAPHSLPGRIRGHPHRRTDLRRTGRRGGEHRG